MTSEEQNQPGTHENEEGNRSNEEVGTGDQSSTDADPKGTDAPEGAKSDTGEAPKTIKSSGRHICSLSRPEVAGLAHGDEWWNPEKTKRLSVWVDGKWVDDENVGS